MRSRRRLLRRRLLRRRLLRRSLLRRSLLRRRQLKGSLLLLLFDKVQFLYHRFHLKQTPADIQISGTQDSVEKGPESKKIVNRTHLNLKVIVHLCSDITG